MDANQTAITWAKFKKGQMGYVGDSESEISGPIRFLQKDRTIPVMFVICGLGDYTALFTYLHANYFDD